MEEELQIEHDDGRKELWLLVIWKRGWIRPTISEGLEGQRR